MASHEGASPQPEDDEEYVFVRSYRHAKTGKLMVAAHYGLTAFRFPKKKKAKKPIKGGDA